MCVCVCVWVCVCIRQVWLRHSAFAPVNDALCYAWIRYKLHITHECVTNFMNTYWQPSRHKFSNYRCRGWGKLRGRGQRTMVPRRCCCRRALQDRVHVRYQVMNSVSTAMWRCVCTTETESVCVRDKKSKCVSSRAICGYCYFLSLFLSLSLLFPLFFLKRGTTRRVAQSRGKIQTRVFDFHYVDSILFWRVGIVMQSHKKTGRTKVGRSCRNAFLVSMILIMSGFLEWWALLCGPNQVGG